MTVLSADVLAAVRLQNSTNCRINCECTHIHTHWHSHLAHDSSACCVHADHPHARTHARTSPLVHWPISCTYFLVTGLRVHLGCRSGAAAEGWSSGSRRGSVGALGVAQWGLWGRQEGLWGLDFHLYSKQSGYKTRSLPLQCLCSVHVRSVEGSSAPPDTQPVSLRLCLSLTACCCRVFKGWALSLCLFLLRLSLLVTPPCVPTPHLSVSQELRSPAEEPSCRRSDTGCRRERRRAEELQH